MSKTTFASLEFIQMEAHEIIAVKIVGGSELNPRWKSPMQVITTDKGEFIDNMPGKQFGFFPSAKPGIDWKPHIGQRVTEIRVFDYSGYMWLNKQ